MRLRSLTVKLTLAFLFVGLTGAVLVALFVERRTRDEFDRFVLNREQAILIDDLSRYYRSNESWQNVSTLFLNDSSGDSSSQEDAAGIRRRARPLPLLGTLVDANSTIILSAQPSRVGHKIAPDELTKGVPIRTRDGVAGWFIFDNRPAYRLPGPALVAPPEQAFLDSVRRAILIGAVGATVVALALGILLARTLTRPIRELTSATRVVAKGKLGHQVNVRSKDELGDLASSFNQMSRDLAQASQQRRQMTADVAHDLRTPLSILLGYTEALSDGKLQGTPDIHTVMHHEAQHLSHLVDDLRTLSLADAGELALNLQACLPYDMLARTAAAHQGQAGQKNITLAVAASRDLPPVLADPERMAQVLSNLVTNALRYTPEGGQITLSASAAKSRGVLQVQDTGGGILPEDLPNIFNRFYRADKSRQQQQGESGLGLAIARSIVEAHGGTITVESAPSQGTTFTILLGQAEAD